MTSRQHALRVIGLLAIAAGLLISMAVRADLIFADGLRYIDQASRISRGAVSDGLFRSIDHPGYPLAIAAVHAVLGGEGPGAWQGAAQAAAVLAGVLLVIPLYLVTAELFGPRIAWLGCLLVYLAPIPCRVMADALSESTFLLFWTWGLWAAIRFLKEGSLRWLPLLVCCGVLAYLTRPEGMLLPAALVATLLMMPLFPATRLSWRRWGPAFGFLVIAPLCVVGPYVVAKGGLGTKPALARVLGMAAQAPADSVERARPLDPNQSLARTHCAGGEGNGRGRRRGDLDSPAAPGRSRALERPGRPGSGADSPVPGLHRSGGASGVRQAARDQRLLHVAPCPSARPLGIPAAAAGLDWLLRRVSCRPRIQRSRGLAEPRPVLLAALAAVYLAWSAPGLCGRSIMKGLGYRLAGEWLADRTHAPEDAKVVDGPAWSLFYGQRAGYTFENLEAPWPTRRRGSSSSARPTCLAHGATARSSATWSGDSSRLPRSPPDPTRPSHVSSCSTVGSRVCPGQAWPGDETGDKRVR